MVKFSRYETANYLRDEEDMALYLDACIDEDPGDGSLIRLALGDIAKARGMTQMAKDSGISRDGLYSALSPTGNPAFTTILKVIKALGLQLHARKATHA